jgi:putative tryptophan/tyrosine transport system substrate-binding protein
MRCARFRPRPKRWVSKSTNSKFGARRILRRLSSGSPAGAQALYVCPDPLVNSNRVRIGILALGLRLPTVFGFREYFDPAGLMSYGPNIPDLFRRAGEYVDKILRGAKAGELPVEQPTKFELVVNLTVAKALGLKLPESFLLRADEMIE